MSAEAGLDVALIQARTGTDQGEAAAVLAPLLDEAADAGATLIATPEATNLVQRDSAALRRAVRPVGADPVAALCARTARERGVWILAGSLMVAAEDGAPANRAHLFGPDGAVAATYDKIHLFDVRIGEGETYRESDSFRAGDRAVVVDGPWGRLGLSICYDLRFPHLYRALAQAGCALIAAPSAFTRPTGRAHWETLIRARAIETGAFILAPAQGGRHQDGRGTWGRSMIVDPWGAVAAAFDHDAPGVLRATLDLTAVDAARARIPALTHDRPFAPPAAAS